MTIPNIMRRAGGMMCLLALGACSTPLHLGGDPALGVVSASALPPPDRIDLASSSRAYYVGPFDRLTIGVFGIEELSGLDVQVDAAGKISFPLAGILDVAGKTPAEIEQMLAARLEASYVRDPQVTVNLKETVSQVVTIEGQVAKPGLYPVVGKMTLMRAIATAQGTTEFSKTDDVVIFRTVGGHKLAALYDLDAVRHGAYPDPEIFANDVVMVGDDNSRRLFKDIISTMPAVVTPLVIAADRLLK